MFNVLNKLNNLIKIAIILLLFVPILNKINIKKSLYIIIIINIVK